jgi:hypothetical protein
VSIPFIIVGAILPSFVWWINYVVYPFGSALLVITYLALWGSPSKKAA